MTYTTTDNSDGTTTIDIDYSDEGVTLSASTKIIGGEDRAAAYAHVFAEDIRRINSHLWPTPEPSEEEEE